MTRFLYLSDTHAGASGQGYHQQTPYPGKSPEILAAVRGWMEENGPIDFVLHGGDMVDSGTPDQIRECLPLFDWPVPVHLCLGNHDLAERDSLKHWLDAGRCFFSGGRPEYLIETTDCAIVVIPNQWCDVPYYWLGSGRPEPFFFPEQRKFLEECFRRTRGKPQILATHSPVFALPKEQTGMDVEFHPPYGNFSQVVPELIRPFPDVRCVLGAHNHLNMRVEKDGVQYVTSSALIESPFEFKLFEINGGSVRMKTVSLASRIPFDAKYDATRTYVQGRGVDREFETEVARFAHTEAEA